MAYGTYLVSFLRIYIDTDKSLKQLDAVDPHEAGMFAHEYTHFLQNITSSFGQMHVWGTYDRLRQYIVGIQKNGKDELKLPLMGAIADEQRCLLIIRANMKGDERITRFMEDITTQVVGHHFVKDEEHAKLYPYRDDLHYLELDVKDGRGWPDKYKFGETAVSETMAYLIERKYYQDGDPAPEYPYRAGQHLVEYMGANWLKDENLLFALCDVSLLSGYPGMIFFRIIEDLQAKNNEPKSAEELFDYGIQFMYDNGIQVFEQYENNMNGAVHVLEHLLPHPDMKPTAEWVGYLLRMGFRIRKEIPHLMINLYREPALFNGYWNKIMLQFGNPSLHNKTTERLFKAPYDLKEIEELIDPIHLLVVQEVLMTLVQKDKKQCSLYKYCEQSTNGLKVDDRCKNAPWLRALDEKTCAYGALWSLYGLGAKKVIQES